MTKAQREAHKKQKPRKRFSKLKPPKGYRRNQPIAGLLSEGQLIDLAFSHMCAQFITDLLPTETKRDLLQRANAGKLVAVVDSGEEPQQQKETIQ